MGPTDVFRRQHRELLDIASQLAPLLTPDKCAAQASQVREMLSKLAGKLTVHLSMEDRSMYPKLLGHPDPQVSGKAKKYHDELGGLKQAFSTYAGKWNTPEVIQKNPKDFIQETNGIFEALSKRIEREDSDLYVMVDKVGLD